MALTRNGTHGIRPKRSDRNLTGISGSSRDFKRGKTCSILFRFFNGYETFRAFRPKWHGINNSGLKITKTIDKNEVLLRKMQDYIFKILRQNKLNLIFLIERIYNWIMKIDNFVKEL